MPGPHLTPALRQRSFPPCEPSDAFCRQPGAEFDGYLTCTFPHSPYRLSSHSKSTTLSVCPLFSPSSEICSSLALPRCCLWVRAVRTRNPAQALLLSNAECYNGVNQPGACVLFYKYILQSPGQPQKAFSLKYGSLTSA